MKYKVKLKKKELSLLQTLVDQKAEELLNFGNKEDKKEVRILHRILESLDIAWLHPVENKFKFKRKLIGPGVSNIFGGFPKDLVLEKIYTIIWESENQQYILKDYDYKASSFKWDKPLPKLNP